jgi:histidine triad (HIT) family protein
MSAHSYLALWATVAKLAPGLQSVTSAKRVGVAVEGFAVPHVHVHMVPLYAREELNPARAKPISPGDAEGLARGLREAFGA